MIANNRNRKYIGLFSIVGLIVVLAIAWGLDSFIAYLAPRLPRLAPRSCAGPCTLALISLLLAALLLLLFWFVLISAPRNVWIAALYLLVGLFLAFFRVLYFVPAIGSWMPPSLYYPLLSATSSTVLAGSFIAIIGLFMLILPRRPR